MFILAFLSKCLYSIFYEYVYVVVCIEAIVH